MGSFDDFKGILPYASEIFGVYQPLLGWKSRRIASASAPQASTSRPTAEQCRLPCATQFTSRK